MRPTRSSWIIAVFVLSSLLLMGCTPPTPAGPGPGPTTPPACIGHVVIKTVPVPDISSIRIEPGSTGMIAAVQWCEPAVSTDLKITALTPTETNNLLNTNGCPDLPTSGPPACSPLRVLAAVDVTPNNVDWSTSSTSLQPKLTYDLKQHPVTCTGKDCPLNYLKVYQLQSPNSWLYVGDAVEGTSGTIPIATADIDHFSTFALVLVPPPQAIPGAGSFQMLVNSRFYDDHNKGVEVAFLIQKDSSSLLRSDNKTRNFTFRGVTEIRVPAGAGTPPPARCLQLQGNPEKLTCLLPYKTPVELNITGKPGSYQVSIKNIPLGYTVLFNAADILIY